MNEQMLMMVKEKIEFTYANAVERHEKNPIVFVLDVRDKAASWMAERFTERSKIDQEILAAAKLGTTLVMTIGVSHKQAVLLLEQLNPNSAAIFAKTQVPHTHFLVIGITEGKISGSPFAKP